LVMVGLFWKPFDARFEDILEDFKFHADVVKTDLLLTQLFQTNQGKSALSGQINELNNRISETERAREAKNKALTGLEAQILEQKHKGTQYIVEQAGALLRFTLLQMI
jgi:hypothetical protein